MRQRSMSLVTRATSSGTPPANTPQPSDTPQVPFPFRRADYHQVRLKYIVPTQPQTESIEPAGTLLLTRTAGDAMPSEDTSALIMNISGETLVGLLHRVQVGGCTGMFHPIVWV